MLEHRQPTPAKPDRVVVLGASGFIGQSFLKKLKSLGIDAVGTASAAIDLTDPSSVAKLGEVVNAEDTVVFISALTPDRGRDAGTVIKNLKMADHFAQFMEKKPFSYLLYVGSDAVYSDAEDLLRETSACAPSSYHGYMHLGRELILQQAAAKLKMPLGILRPVSVYGAGDTHNSYGPNRFFKTAFSEKVITLFGEGEEQRDHVFIDDVAELMALAIQHQSVGVLNVATGKSIAFGDIARQISQLLGGATKLDCKPRQSPVTHKHFDTTACIRAFPQFQYTALEAGLQKTFAKLSQ